MPYGNFYYGKNGFLFKKNGTIGGRYNPSLATICNQPQNVFNKYVYGAGVGASSTAQRRAKLIHAYKGCPQTCGQGQKRLGLYIRGGTNAAALNWTLNNGCPVGVSPEYCTIAEEIPLAPGFYYICDNPSDECGTINTLTINPVSTGNCDVTENVYLQEGLYKICNNPTQCGGNSITVKTIL